MGASVQFVLMLALVLGSAQLGGKIARRLGQPAVLGELLAGLVLGNLGSIGVSWANAIPGDRTLDALASLAAMLLLFQVGLESTVGDMMNVGAQAFAVAVVGVSTPW